MSLSPPSRPGLLPALLAFAAALATGLAAPAPALAEVDFNRDIRPLLADRCFACHGPDAAARKASLRLDLQEGATSDRGGKGAAIVPGDAPASLLVERITSPDPDEVMPPPETGKSLTGAEVALLRRWIAEGAPWEAHWAFIPPAKPSLPEVSRRDWPRTSIDAFLLARMEEEGLAPNPEAGRRALIRRLSLDLTGLPPAPEELRAFLADRSPKAYEDLVDRLLGSPRYGEHMARYWLDAARYGDTHGLHLDNYREFWPYRGWVIRAFNENKSFADFVLEQLAGDLLPEPTLDQRVATGFNRAHVTTNEGGSIKEEVYVRNVIDRVETTGTVFLGLTLGCAVCHDHKFDPLTQRDFYQFFAYFNSLDGDAMDGNKKDHAPVLKVPSPEQRLRLERIRGEVAGVRDEARRQVAQFKYREPRFVRRPKPPEPADRVWFDDDLPAGARAQGGWKWVGKPAFSGKKASTRTATGLSQHFFDRAKDTLAIGEGDVLFAQVFLDPKNPPVEIMLQFNDGNWDHRAYWGENKIDWGVDGTVSRHFAGQLPEAGRWVRLEVPAAAVGLKPGTALNGWAFTQFDGTVHWDRAGIVTTGGQKRIYDSYNQWVREKWKMEKPDVREDIARLLKTPEDEVTAEIKGEIKRYFIEHVFSGSREIFDPLHEKVAALEKEAAEVEKGFATSLVWKERKQPKDAFILVRGQYDNRGEKVGRALPEFLPPAPEGAPPDRLGLARWLLSDEHPLTARVTVNRFWQQVFGRGLVETAEDFGAQGTPPSHPALLDWLAVDFREHGWDVKRLMKQIVMSAAYRQSSHFTPEKRARDPRNILLARGPRFRLDAEALRDQALYVSGLLVEQEGGPSVKPPQPDGLWFAVGYTSSNTARFKADTGREKVHRRSLYTFWKRTAPPPQMNTFDAPSRETCSVRRERTNTPLQALLLMNDPQYFEAARALAERMIKEGGSGFRERVDFGYETALARPADRTEHAVVRALYDDALAAYKEGDGPAEARKAIAVGESKPDPDLDPVELAPYTLVANLILNLDEFVTKE